MSKKHHDTTLNEICETMAVFADTYSSDIAKGKEQEAERVQEAAMRKLLFLVAHYQKDSEKEFQVAKQEISEALNESAQGDKKTRELTRSFFDRVFERTFPTQVPSTQTAIARVVHNDLQKQLRGW